MVSFKLSGVKSQEVKTGFEAYDGPIPKSAGFYPSEIKKLEWGTNSSKSKGFKIVVEVKAPKGHPKAEFNGFPMFIQSIITESADGSPLKEGAERNLSNFLAALGAPDEPTVVTAPGKNEGWVTVTKIGGKNPVGKLVNIDCGTETYDDEVRIKANGIYPLKASAPLAGSDDAEEEDEEAEEAEEEESEEEDEEFNARAAELEALTVVKLRGIAKPLGIATPGLDKDALIDAILGSEFETEEEEDEEEEEEDDEVEVEEDEEEEEEEEEEDEEDDPAAERREELSTLDRPALRKALKEVAPDYTILKKHTDDELREAILAVEFSETPF